MRRRTTLAVLGLAAMAVLAFAQSAAAATTVGNPCAATAGESKATIVGLTSGAGEPYPAAVPSAGVITGWSLNLGLPIESKITYNAVLKILRPGTAPGMYTVVGESAPGLVHFGVNSYQTRIPVQAGDLLANTGTISLEGMSETISLACKTGNTGDKVGIISGSPAVGSSTSINSEGIEFGVPVTAIVEPDADGDGYGDETQDKCPTNASTHEACPAPPAPITLSASTAVKKGLVTVTLTASAQATVTVGGTVKVSGSKVKLSGGTQTVTPGALAKFTVLFPAKLKKQLKKTPTSKKLTLELSASAPGATTKAFKVKVKGQKKPKPKKS